MLVQLDEETWEVSNTIRLEEVLATLNNQAEAQGRLVTQMTVDNQPMTDRDLVSQTLTRVASSFGTIAAKSERMDSIIEHSGETGKKFGQQICLCAQQLVGDLRQGKGVMRQLDEWFGQMADYLEWAQIQQAINGSQPSEQQDLSYWVNELMNARENLDDVRMADMLEYEVIPRLPQ
jgi:hypothetical protein